MTKDLQEENELFSAILEHVTDKIKDSNLCHKSQANLMMNITESLLGLLLIGFDGNDTRYEIANTIKNNAINNVIKFDRL